MCCIYVLKLCASKPLNFKIDSLREAVEENYNVEINTKK